ncbi:MAG: ABC transporter permease [Saprospiraceae bacterium]
MLKNYIKVAYRNLSKRSLYTAIMIVGLAIGLAFSLIIGSFVCSEYQVNRKLKNIKNHYLLTSQWAKPNMGIEMTTLAPLAAALREKYPDLISNNYSIDAINAIVKKRDKVFNEGIQLGDPAVLEMYGFTLLHGDMETALLAPDKMVITKKMALKYFGKTDVLNEILEVESFSGKRRDFVVTGILDDLPFNSVTHLAFKKTPILMSNENLKFFNRYKSYNSWSNAYVASFIELKDGVSPQLLSQAISQLIKDNAETEVVNNLEVRLEPLSSFYLSFNGGLVQKTIYSLILIGLFILFMAIINFINITIGNSTERVREMGVRKTLGGKRKQIIIQFLIESIMLAIISTAMSLFIYEMSKDYFADILGKPLISIWEFSPVFVIFTLLLAVLVGVLSGLYPAMSISSLPTVDSLKGKLTTVRKNVRFRQVLMTLQFAISLFVIAATFLVSQQINFLFDKDLGFNKDQIVHVRTPRQWSSEGVAKMITVRNEMNNLADVTNASLAYEIPDGNAGYNTSIYRQGQDSSAAFYAPMMQVDENYIEAYDIHLAHGRFFNKAHYEIDHSHDVVINETASASLGFDHPEEALNTMIHVGDLGSIARIIGIVKDFHFGSMHDDIKPIVIADVRSTVTYRYLAFKINTTDMTHTLSMMESKWKDLLPNAPFNYNFLDLTLQNLYQSEIRLKKATHIASFLSVIIVLIGVFGLVSISIIRRTKEVGIRKILGASLSEIIWLFLKEFIIIAIISIGMIFPFIYHFGNEWLNNFAYSTQIDYGLILVFALVFCMIIVLLVTAHIFYKIRANPAESLRNE